MRHERNMMTEARCGTSASVRCRLFTSPPEHYQSHSAQRLRRPEDWHEVKGRVERESGEADCERSLRLKHPKPDARLEAVQKVFLTDGKQTLFWRFATRKTHESPSPKNDQ